MKKVFNDGELTETENKARGPVTTPRNQGCLNSYFTEYNRIRLPRK